MKRFALMVALLPTLALAEPRLALTRDSEAGFRELIRRAQQGALGVDVNNLNATIQQDRVRVDLKEREGGVRTLFLRQNSEGSGGFFRIEAGDHAKPEDVAHLRELLGTAFKEDPFLVENDGMDGARAVTPTPVAEALHNAGVMGAAVALADHASGPISRGTMLMLALSPFLGLLLAIGAVWVTALGRDSDLKSP